MEFSLSEADLEKFRSIGLVLNHRGQFWHEGQPVTHPGLTRALFSWLDVLPNGRTIVRLDAQRFAYVEVEDCHLLATSARWIGDRDAFAELTLHDGTSEIVGFAQVDFAASGSATCQVRNGKLRARLSPQAAYEILSHAEQRNQATGFMLRNSHGELIWQALPQEPAPAAS